MKTSGYTRTAIVLHWTIALMIAGSFSVGLYMSDLPFSPWKFKVFAWHKWAGVTIFGLVLLRLLWRLGHPAPALPGTMPAWQRTGAHLSHLLIYVLMVAIPLSGWLYSSATGISVVYFNLIPLPDLLAKDKALASQLKEVHETLNWTLLAIVALHTAAALKHQFVDRDGLLMRMLKPQH